MREIVIFRKGDKEQFFSFAVAGLYWSKKYTRPASKWFGHIIGRLYFRKWQVSDITET